MATFHKATKTQSRLRLALAGPAGSGKTYSALAVASALGGRIALIDSEKGSASKYAGTFNFDVCELDSFHPKNYIDAIHSAEAAGYEIVIIDSLSAAWSGKDGALELVDNAAARSQSKNSWAAWREITPLQNALVDAMISSKCHIIATMRSKTEWVLEKDERTGKTMPKKIGMAPIQRDEIDFNFDVFGTMDAENNFIVSKTRCSELAGKVINRPSAQLAQVLKAWLSDGVPAAAASGSQPAPSSASSATAPVPYGRSKATAPAGAPAKRDPEPASIGQILTPVIDAAQAARSAAATDKEKTRLALRAFAGKHGMNHAVAKMKAITGREHLDDVEPSKYSALIAALSGAAQIQTTRPTANKPAAA